MEFQVKKKKKGKRSVLSKYRYILSVFVLTYFIIKLYRFERTASIKKTLQKIWILNFH